jgi:hypothetical protein
MEGGVLGAEECADGRDHSPCNFVRVERLREEPTDVSERPRGYFGSLQRFVWADESGRPFPDAGFQHHVWAPLGYLGCLSLGLHAEYRRCKSGATREHQKIMYLRHHRVREA